MSPPRDRDAWPSPFDALAAHDRGCTCPDCCDSDDDAPTRAELDWADYEDRAREARRSLTW